MSEKSMTDMVNEIMEREKPEMLKKLYDAAVKELQDGVSWKIRESVEVETTRFFKQEIAPELGNKLLEMKAEILTSITTSVAKSMAMIGDRMVENATKNMSQSWNLKELMKRLFE